MMRPHYHTGRDLIHVSAFSYLTISWCMYLFRGAGSRNIAERM